MSGNYSAEGKREGDAGISKLMGLIVTTICNKKYLFCNYNNIISKTKPSYLDSHSPRPYHRVLVTIICPYSLNIHFLYIYLYYIICPGTRDEWEGVVCERREKI